MDKAVLKSGAARNYWIDALRFIAICFVVYIHIFAINRGIVFSNGISWKFIDVTLGLSRLAVPIFFGISGWFIFSKDRSEQIAKLKKQIPKLTKILLVATIGANIAMIIIYALLLHGQSYQITPAITDLFEAFALGRSPTQAVGPLWFLTSLIIVEVIFWIASHKLKRDDWLILPAFIFFALNLSFGAYQTLTGFEQPPFPINENWFVGFAWFSVGYFLAKYFKDKLSSIKKKTLVSFTIISGLLYLYEDILQTSGSAFHFGPYNYVVIFLFTPFITAGILLLAARSSNAGKIVRTLASLGKNYALGIFIIHVIVMEPVGLFFTHYNILANSPMPKLFVTYMCTLLLSLGITAFYYRFKPTILNGLGYAVRRLGVRSSKLFHS
jgi:surface polysaccharide O-acyltransferase-like enzyme